MQARRDAATLMAEMTLAEKIGQLNLLSAGEGLATGTGATTVLGERLDQGAVGAVFAVKSLDLSRRLQDRALAGSRLQIPLFFAEDVIHGHRTIFPLPIGLASSWNMALVEETAAYAAAESAAEGLHQVYAPMIDVSRDPRWGRVAESPGEDPLLAARYAAAMTRGLQGHDPAGPGKVAACLKHFVAYGATQSGRDYDNASLAWEDLLGVYLPPFRAGIEAGAASVMAAFNAVNKLPMHAHAPLIEGWLRQGTGFDGLVVSDYTGVAELVAHGIGTPAMVVARALHAGIDMDMVGEDYVRELPHLAAQGIAAPDCGLRMSGEEIVRLIDRACLRVLTFKERLGLLADPYKGLDLRQTPPDRAAGRRLARRAGAESVVLLKNGGLLPLAPRGRIALVGPFADDRLNMIGTWSVSGDARNVTTLREAVASRQVDLVMARGANVVDEAWMAARLNVHGETVTIDPHDPADLIDEAVRAARGADVAIVALGEAREAAGESASVLAPVLPEPQIRLLRALAGTGTPLVVLVFAARPLALGPVPDLAGALVYCWHGGHGGPEGVADILFGDTEPSGRLPVTLPAHPGEVPLSYATEPTGRPFRGMFEKFRSAWLDLPDGADAAFPFGFGLGYGKVVYGGLDLTAGEAAGPHGRIGVRVPVSNHGDRPAVETVQLYLSDPIARITRPGRQLIDFRQIRLAPGETQEVRFEISVAELSYPVAPALDSAEWVWDPGTFLVHVGANSRDTETAEIWWLA
jgi:beta-glucosidase